MPDSSRHQASPAARAQARRVAQTIGAPLKNRSPRTEVATVADTSFHHEQGYVLATASRGPIQVLGVPYNSVVPGMRMFVRRFSYQGQTSYLYDGLTTPAVSISNSGSIASVSGQNLAAGSGASLISPPYTGNSFTVPVGTPATGWFWSFFYYLPNLPSPGSYYILLETAILDGTGFFSGRISFVVDYRARLGIWIEGTTWPAIDDYITANTIFWTEESYSPQQIWWLTFQMGIGLSVNGILRTTGIDDLLVTLGAPGVSAAGPAGKALALFVLARYDGFYAAPPASWVSKIVVGANINSSDPTKALSPFPLIVDPPLDSDPRMLGAYIPSSDDTLIDLSQCSYGMWRYLCNDSPDSIQIPDSSGNDFWLRCFTTNTHGVVVKTADGYIRTSGPY